MANCTHTHGGTLCFECFRAGMERTRARREAYAQRALPFEAPEPSRDARLSEQAITHRRQMLEYLERTAGGR
jgi:hypothetical protein